jgi:hypothetical protein
LKFTVYLSRYFGEMKVEHRLQCLRAIDLLSVICYIHIYV